MVAQRAGERGTPSAVALFRLDAPQRGDRVPEHLVRKPAVSHFVCDVGELLLCARFLAERMIGVCALDHGLVSFARLAVPPLAAIEVPLEQIRLQRIDRAHTRDRLLRQVQPPPLDRREIQAAEIFIGLQRGTVDCPRERATVVFAHHLVDEAGRRWFLAARGVTVGRDWPGHRAWILYAEVSTMATLGGIRSSVSMSITSAFETLVHNNNA